MQDIIASLEVECAERQRLCDKWQAEYAALKADFDSKVEALGQFPLSIPAIKNVIAILKRVEENEAGE